MLPADFKQTDDIKSDEDNRGKYSTRDQAAQKSFCDRYGSDERDGPPEDEEELEYVDEPDDGRRIKCKADDTEIVRNIPICRD